MKTFSLSSCSLVLLAGLFVGCSHGSENTATAEPSSTNADTTTPSSASNDASTREGWSEVKSGAKEAATGAGEIAEDAGESIKEGAQNAAKSVKKTACPVLGNKQTKTFYSKDHKNYDSLLNGNKALAYDNRECFMNEANAREAGYKNSAK